MTAVAKLQKLHCVNRSLLPLDKPSHQENPRYLGDISGGTIGLVVAAIWVFLSHCPDSCRDVLAMVVLVGGNDGAKLSSSPSDLPSP